MKERSGSDGSNQPAKPPATFVRSKCRFAKGVRCIAFGPLPSGAIGSFSEKGARFCNAPNVSTDCDSSDVVIVTI